MSRRCCTGYRNARYQLVALNEKAAAQKLSASLQFTNNYTSPSLSARFTFITKVEDQAICNFVKNFVLVPTKGSSRRYMDFLIPMIGEEQFVTNIKSTVCSAVMAVALALLGNRPNSKPLIAQATQQYARALKRVNEALADPKRALEDRTLMTVLLLSHFEVIKFPRSI